MERCITAIRELRNFMARIEMPGTVLMVAFDEDALGLIESTLLEVS